MPVAALDSKYVIDGVPQEQTPVQMLSEVMLQNHPDCADEPDTVVDESLDPSLNFEMPDPSRALEYADALSDDVNRLPLPYSEQCTRIILYSALIDALWHTGHFKLGNLAVRAGWDWDFSPVGAGSAFFSSVRAVRDSLDSLGISLDSFSCADSNLQHSMVAEAVFAGSSVCFADEDADAAESFYGSAVKCPATLLPDNDSWLIYIPFDTSDFRLGGSLLSDALGQGGGVAPSVDDADYFMDCFEVVRELVEDGVIVSACTVGRGGLMRALSGMCSRGVGISADISGIMSASGESQIVRILYAEVPGALVQIRDMDFDYLDAELLLQDVAFYPLGHPTPGKSGIRLNSSAKNGIQTILESLIRNAEGED